MVAGGGGGGRRRFSVVGGHRLKAVKRGCWSRYPGVSAVVESPTISKMKAYFV